MKRNNINRFFKLGLFALMVATIGFSCVKSREGRTDFENLKPTVLIPEGGLSNFGSQTLVYPPTDNADTVNFHVNYAATDVAPADEVIGIAIDDAALAAYNAANGTNYQKFPDSIYSFAASSNITVPKGANYSSNIPFIVFPSKVDPTVSYMLAITIKTVPTGATLSSNFATIYYHFIGNPIAGAYTWDWTRWNAADTTGTPTGTSFKGQSTIFSPDDPNTIEVYAGYIYPGVRYIIHFDNNAGVLSNFTVSLNQKDIDNNLTPSNIAVTAAPKFLYVDSVNHVFRIIMGVSSGGKPRTLIDYYYH
jgi:hypothetical protein